MSVKPGVIGKDNGSSPDESLQAISGWYRTIELTINADKVLTTLYPDEQCTQIVNQGSSDGVVKYYELNDPDTIKTVNLSANGGASGILPRIKTILVTDTSATSLKLYTQKIR